MKTLAILAAGAAVAGGIAGYIIISDRLAFNRAADSAQTIAAFCNHPLTRDQAESRLRALKRPGSSWDGALTALRADSCRPAAKLHDLP